MVETPGVGWGGGGGKLEERAAGGVFLRAISSLRPLSLLPDWREVSSFLPCFCLTTGLTARDLSVPLSELTSCSVCCCLHSHLCFFQRESRSEPLVLQVVFQSQILERPPWNQRRGSLTLNYPHQRPCEVSVECVC